MRLRPYAPRDLPHVFDICLRTGDAGRDASALFNDRWLLGRFYAAPYVMLEPESCLILEDRGQPCGYVLGTMDTARFVRWFNVDWHPGLKALAEAAGAPRSGAEADLLRTVQRPLTVPSWAREYPAHLHIDLMPVAQGQGWGRRMMRAWMASAAHRGATGVHLGVARANQRAVEFYRRLGLRALKTWPEALILGARLKPGDEERSLR